MKVGYLGVPGAYSEIAVLDFFNNKKDLDTISYKNFKAIICSVENGELDYAMLPVENTTTGIIYRTVDLMQSTSLYAVGEQYVKIGHCLIGVEEATIDDISKIYSHPEALGQCQDFFYANPSYDATEYNNTATAVKYVKECNDVHKAAIASKRAAEIYDMKVLKENIQDNKLNTTRFLLLRKGECIAKDAEKISLYFVVNHEPGALFKVLKVFAEHNINVLKLESRPLHDRIFEYCFYIDVDGNLESELTQKALREMLKNCSELKIIGNYKKGNKLINTLNICRSDIKVRS